MKVKKSEPKNKETVILLHGLGRTKRSMLPVKRALSKKGYKVVNIGYPSRRIAIPTLVEKYLAPVFKNELKSSSKIHFVTHSMGGILVRFYLGQFKSEKIGRVVMLSPPNKGSEVADFLMEKKILSLIMGPASMQLGTSDNSLPCQLGPVDFDLGVIAGSRSCLPFLSKLIEGPDDGLVSVSSTKVEGLKDFLVVPHTHTFIMASSKVLEQILFFLGSGRFDKI